MNSATSRDRAAPPETAYLRRPPNCSRTLEKTTLSTSSRRASSGSLRRVPARSFAVILSASVTIIWMAFGLLATCCCTAV